MANEDRDIEVVARRYGALDAIAGVFRGLAWITIFGGAIVCLVSGLAILFSNDGEEALLGIAVLAVGLLASIIWGVILLAFADVIGLLMDIEENTRAAALNLAEVD